MLHPVRTAAPEEFPVSLDEVKAHCRVDGNDSDAVLSAYLAAAVDHLDGYAGVLGRALVTQTWRQDFCGFSSVMRLAVWPVGEISSITYFDAENVSQTLDASIYMNLEDARGAFVTLKPDQVWPSSYRRPDAVSVTFVAGTEADEVPAAIKVAILMLAANWFENREAVVTGASAAPLPMGVSALIAPYRRVGV